MPFPSKLDTSIGFLKIQIDGNWNAADFIQLLQMIDSTYVGLNTVFTFSSALQYENTHNIRASSTKGLGQDFDSTVNHLWNGTFYRNTENTFYEKAGPSLQTLIELVKQYEGGLTLASVSYASPGWIEMVGSWNPLKVMTDAINEWRQQNTTRMQNELAAKTEREKNRLNAETERQRIRGDLFKAVLSSSPELWRDNNRRLAEVSEQIVSPAIKAIEHMASDVRITNASLNASPEQPKDNGPH